MSVPSAHRSNHLVSTVAPLSLSGKLSCFYNGLMSPRDRSPGELRSFQTLVDILQRLRAPGGCPWDREQTHASLKRHLLEECYEVLEAIDQSNSDKLAEELGDLLVQVAFHSQIASEEGEFLVEDVLNKANDKLIRRHPHVFGDAKAVDAREVEYQWERLKKAEDSSRSPVTGIPGDLPALANAELLQDRVVRAGFDWEDVSGVVDKVVEEVDELRKAKAGEEVVHELGDLLFTLVNLGRWLGIHAEDALRQANHRFSRRYVTMESLASQRGLHFPSLSLDEKECLWKEAKVLEG